MYFGWEWRELDGETEVQCEDEKLINAILWLNLTHSYAGNDSVRRKFEYITAQDPGEETKEDCG
jgi:hypothetical protein